MKNFFFHVARRSLSTAALCIILVAAILYQTGVYELPFIARSEVELGVDTEQGTPTPTTPVFSDGAIENPSAPPVSDSLLESINGSANISDITSDTASTDSLADTGSSNIPSGGKYEAFTPVGDFGGYSISHKDYSDSSVLAEITLTDYTPPSALYGGSKIKVEFTSAKDNADGIPYSKREFTSDTAMAVELYMGYILIDNGTSLALFSFDGKSLGAFERMYFVPAYTRDSQSNPLFYLTSEGFGKFYRFDIETKAFVEAVYDDELDNRGLYFDYTPDWGLSDNGYNRFSAVVGCIVEMTPEEAFEYTAAPTEPPETSAPETSAPETSAPETSAESSSETSAESSAQVQQSDPPVTDAQTGAESAAPHLSRLPRTEILTDHETAKEFLANARFASSTAKYSNYTISEDGKTVFVEIMERRWAFDRQNYMESDEYKSNPDDKKLSEYFKYYRLYNFSEGLCATVARDGVLSFTNLGGENIIHRDREYYGQNNRKLLSSYAEPVLRGIDSLGSLYFDRGYVLIRQVDIDFQFTDKMSGDYTFLVDKYGTRFTVPSGYNIISYSDGVLLLEKGGYFGYYSTSGKWIAQPIYTYARPFAEGLGVIGFSGSKKGVVDTEGNIIVPFKYDYISGVSSGVMALYGDGAWTLIAKLEK